MAVVGIPLSAFPDLLDEKATSVVEEVEVVSPSFNWSVEDLTLEEKLDMLSGMNFTSTNGIPRVGIPPLKVRVLFQPLVFPSLTQYFRLWIL